MGSATERAEDVLMPVAGTIARALGLAIAVAEATEAERAGAAPET